MLCIVALLTICTYGGFRVEKYWKRVQYERPFVFGLSGHERDQSYTLEPLGGGAEPGVDTARETQKPAHLPSDADLSYPNGFLQSLQIIALYLAMFLVALDMVRSRPGKMYSSWMSVQNIDPV